MNLLDSDIVAIIPGVKIIGKPIYGGQKQVYKCIYKGKSYALKFIVIKDDEYVIAKNNEEEIRCSREVETLKLCNSPFLIKLGEIPLTQINYNGYKVIYFCEDWIEGENLSEHIITNGGKLKEEEVRTLGIHISYAIEELWKNNKIHRDIKPKNIIYSKGDNKFILIDMGMVFDSNNSILTQIGWLPGTIGYFSPEQFDLSRKNDLDFRSDMFCLGIVMYEALTGLHPFKSIGMTNEQIIKGISTATPASIIGINKDVSEEMEKVVFRLLRKRPSERFRSIELFRNTLLSIK